MVTGKALARLMAVGEIVSDGQAVRRAGVARWQPLGKATEAEGEERKPHRETLSDTEREETPNTPTVLPPYGGSPRAPACPRME